MKITTIVASKNNGTKRRFFSSIKEIKNTFARSLFFDPKANEFLEINDLNKAYIDCFKSIDEPVLIVEK